MINIEKYGFLKDFNLITLSVVKLVTFKNIIDKQIPLSKEILK